MPDGIQAWEMISVEWVKYLADKRIALIQRWNLDGSHGFPPALGIDTISNRILLAKTAGYTLPKDAKRIMDMTFHQLAVEAAKCMNKAIPNRVLAEYEDV